MKVRLPRVMADYGCQRTLVCCHHPWSALVFDEELPRMQKRLDPGVYAGLMADLVPSGRTTPPLTVTQEPGGRCSQLQTAGPSCRLQDAGGLMALPHMCRTFPRSVMATAACWEVAFLLACPTAARLVVRHPGPFRWTWREAEGWPYPPLGTVLTVRWDDESQVAVDDFDSFRMRWWQAIDGAHDDGRHLLRLLVTLIIAPELPEVPRDDIDHLANDLDPRLAGHIAGYTTSRRDVPPERRATCDALIEALTAPATVEAMVASASSAPAVWATALSLALQFAGVHTSGAARQGLSKAAFEVVLAIWIHSALRRIGTPAEQALVDALVAASQIGVA